MFCKPVRNLGGAWARDGVGRGPLVSGSGSWGVEWVYGLLAGGGCCRWVLCWSGGVWCSSPVCPWVWVGAVGGHVGWWSGHMKPDTFTYNVEYYKIILLGFSACGLKVFK